VGRRAWEDNTVESSNLELEGDDRILCLLGSNVSGSGPVMGGLSSSLDDGQDICGDNSSTRGGGGSWDGLLLRRGELLSSHLHNGCSMMTGGNSGGLNHAKGRGEGGQVEAGSCGESSHVKGVGWVGVGVVRGQWRIHGGPGQGTNDGLELGQRHGPRWRRPVASSAWSDLGRWGTRGWDGNAQA
jgi:hypothetical protein